MDELRVLHAADLHVDSPMLGLVAYEGAPVETVRAATREAMRALVGAAIEHEVHLVLIAGDLYDGGWRDYNTGLFVVGQLAKLHDAGIPVVLVHGNHDAESQLTRRLRLPPNTTVLASARPESHVLGDLGVAVHGQSYATRAVEADLSAAYPRADAGLLNIGMLHTCLDGSLGHHPYAPCTTTGLRAKQYDYWALGHVHEHTVVCEDPLVVFPGNLQGRHARETGPKGATLVTFRDREARAEQLVLDTVRWTRRAVDVAGARSVDEVLERCREGLLGATGGGTPCDAVRIELVGRTGLDGALRSRQEWLVNEVRALALGLGGADVYLEKVLVSTAGEVGRRFDGDGVAGEIGRVVADLRTRLADVADDEAGPLAAIATLRTQLRAAGGLPADDALEVEGLDAALDDAAALLLGLIGGEEPGLGPEVRRAD